MSTQAEESSAVHDGKSHDGKSDAKAISDPGRRYITKRRETPSDGLTADGATPETYSENSSSQPRSTTQASEPKQTPSNDQSNLLAGEPKRPLGNEPKKPPGNEPKRPSGNEPKRPSGSEPKRPSGSEPKRPSAGKRPSGNEPKRPSGNELKRPSGNEPKRPSGNEPKRPSGNEPKRPSGAEPKRPSGNESKRPSGGDQPKRPEQYPKTQPRNRVSDRGPSTSVNFFHGRLSDRGKGYRITKSTTLDDLELQKRQSAAKLLLPQPPRQRWSSTAQLGTLETVGERTAGDSDTDDLAPLPSDPPADKNTEPNANTTANRKFSAPPAPLRSLVTPIYAPERFGLSQAAFKGLPVVYVPVPVAMPGGSKNAITGEGIKSEEALKAAASTIRLQCKYWKQGNCKFGESCLFSHSDDSIVLLPPMPQVIPPPQSHAPSGNTKQQKSTEQQKWRGVGSLPKEQTLAALRLLAHIEEVQANHMDASIGVDDGSATTITELYYRLESREVDPPVPVVVILNDLINSEEFLSVTECASRIVPLLPEATLDLGAILNTSRLVDNDALLFFCHLLRDVQEHFYHEFKSKYLVTTPDGTYNTDYVGKILEQLGVTEQEIMSKFNFSEAKKSIQGSKRWRSLFILNDPTLITLVNKQVYATTAEDLKWQILRRLDEHVRAVIRTKELSVISSPSQINGRKPDSPLTSPHAHSTLSTIEENPPSPRQSSSLAKLPSFEVRAFDEPRGQSARKKLWNEYATSMSPIELYSDLCRNVAELVVPGLTNFPAIFSVLSEKLKMRRFHDGEKNLDTKLAAISKMLTTWPEVLLLPEVLQRADGKLHVYRSVTAQHQFGSVYVEMMTRLKKKYLYKSSLEKLS